MLDVLKWNNSGPINVVYRAFNVAWEGLFRVFGKMEISELFFESVYLSQTKSPRKLQNFK